MITDIAGAIVAHQMRHEAARRGIRKSAASRARIQNPRAAVAIRP